MKHWMQGEIGNFINVWLMVYISLCYCFIVSKIASKGFPRLLVFSPVICLFLFVPLKLHSVHLCGTTAFFITWLANFKLLMLAFNYGPLSHPSLSLPRFLILACLPIKIQKNYIQTREDSLKNGHSAESAGHPPPKFMNVIRTTQNCHFQENPPPKFKNVIRATQNGHFQETPSPDFKNVITETQNDIFQENPSSESSKIPRNGIFQENPPQEFKNVIKATQSGNFQENPPPKFKNVITAPQNGIFQENPSPESSKTLQNGIFQEKPSVKISGNRQKSAMSYSVKALMMGLIIKIYDYSDSINPTVIMIIYCFHIYFCLEIILAIVAAMARLVLGLELEPQFNEPYLSTSLQDFWGRRWNLMVNRILRPTVYNPVHTLTAKYLGRKWATFPAVISTFIVSGLMHELIFFYLGRAWPTWEITWFFLLHGACLTLEIAVKKALNDTCQLPRILGTILTVGFVMITGFWLFFPQLLRCEADIKALAEYAALGAFVRDLVITLTVQARCALT